MNKPRLIPVMPDIKTHKPYLSQAQSFSRVDFFSALLGSK